MAMPAQSRQPPRRWTTRDVRELIANNPLVAPRYELVDGELLVTPSPNFAHQRAVNLLWKILDEYLRPLSIGVVSTSPFDVELEPEFLSQPESSCCRCRRHDGSPGSCRRQVTPPL